MSNANDNVVVSSRVRLARNCRNMPFPQRMNDFAQVKELIIAAEKAATFKHKLILMEDLLPVERQSLVEKHLISPDLARKDTGALILSADNSIAIMVNEEDHIRAQCIKNGSNLQQCYNAIDKYDDKLSEIMPVAYDSEFGYLTACLTNVGTGMRASVMVFLPALTYSNKIAYFVDYAQQRGITVRGVYGEGSDPNGCLYQISNGRSIGSSEQNLIDGVMETVNLVCAVENGTRLDLYHSAEMLWTDKIYRAYGVLCNARMLSSNEFMEYVALLKFGMEMDIIRFNDVKSLEELIVDTQPANLMLYAGTDRMDAEERDKFRAEVVRKRIEKLI